MQRKFRLIPTLLALFLIITTVTLPVYGRTLSESGSGKSIIEKITNNDHQSLKSEQNHLCDESKIIWSCETLSEPALPGQYNACEAGIYETIPKTVCCASFKQKCEDGQWSERKQVSDWRCQCNSDFSISDSDSSFDVHPGD